MNDLPEDRLLSERDAALFLACSRSFLANSRWRGTREAGADGPPFIRLGKTAIRYCLSDLRQWLAIRKQTPRGFPT